MREPIRSGDPNAIEHLIAKRQSLIDLQQQMKKANRIIKGKGSDVKKINDLVKMGISLSRASQLLQPDYCGRIGFASYQLTNNNANIRNIDKRIESLKRLDVSEPVDKEVSGIRLVVNKEENRVQLFFPGKPSEEVRDRLKSRGFKWAPTQGAWQRILTENAISAANWLLKNLHVGAE